MYRTCAFGDCDVSFDRCEIHHVTPYFPDGLTDLNNLIPACSHHHHHLIHDLGWQLDLAPDRTLTIRHPNGTIYMVCHPDINRDLWQPQPGRDDEQGPDQDRQRQPAA